MFATSFPDLRWLKDQTENRFNKPHPDADAIPGKGWPTVLLNVKASGIFRDNILGPLSLFSNWKGRSRVTADNRSVEIPTECFMLTNPQQRYTLEIGESAAETFNIHFGEQWMHDSFISLTKTHEWLTNHTLEQRTSQIHFYNKLFPKSPEISRLLRKLQQHGTGDAMRRDEMLFELFTVLLREHEKTSRKADQISAVKASTRQEIIKKLHLATDFMYSSSEKSLNLDQLSRVSMLSKFHLVRAFKEVYHQTPYQFITTLKIEKAKGLLKTTNADISEISDMLGFDTASTFSRRFKHVTGRYPSQFRAAN